MAYPYAADSLEQQPYIYYLEQYVYSDPHEISSRMKIPYYDSVGAFRVRFLERLYEVTYPEFSVRHLEEREGPFPLEENIYAKVLLLRYLLEGDQSDFSGNMLAYRDLPWGDTYYPTFQRLCVQRLARQYGSYPEAFCRAMDHLYGVPMSFGDYSYQFELFHGLYLCFILWQGDEEYPPNAQILFSDNFPVAFTAEDAAQAVDLVLDCMQAYQVRKNSEKIG